MVRGAKCQTEMDKYLSLKIKIKNDSSYEQPISTNWFLVYGSSGKEYSGNKYRYQTDFEVSNFSSNSTRTGILSNIYVNKTEQEFNIKVILPNKAEQIVKIKNK